MKVAQRFGAGQHFLTCPSRQGRSSFAPLAKEGDRRANFLSSLPGRVLFLLHPPSNKLPGYYHRSFRDEQNPSWITSPLLMRMRGDDLIIIAVTAH